MASYLSKIASSLLKQTFKQVKKEVVKPINSPKTKKIVIKDNPTKINEHYREGDIQRYQDSDFIVGYEVHRSNNQNECKICKQLAGKYPKWFVFSGWCDHCKCYITSILKTPDEMDADDERILKGKSPLKRSINIINDVPPGFKKWVRENLNNPFKNGKPKFIIDNFIDGDLKRGLKYKQTR